MFRWWEVPWSPYASFPLFVCASGPGPGMVQALGTGCGGVSINRAFYCCARSGLVPREPVSRQRGPPNEMTAAHTGCGIVREAS